MGERPEGLTIERYDVNGNYCPENCKWATTIEQANNKRNNYVIEYSGKSQTMAQWSEELGIKLSTLFARLKYNRIATCRGCQAEESGLKSRIAIPHTCGLEPMSIKTKLFYAIEDPESPESDEPTIHHKWGKWKKEPIPKILRGAVTGLAVRKCSVCGANQHRTYYRGQKYPSLDIERNGRSDVDCNPELKPQSKT